MEDLQKKSYRQPASRDLPGKLEIVKPKSPLEIRLYHPITWEIAIDDQSKFNVALGGFGFTLAKTLLSMLPPFPRAKEC